MKAPPTRYKVVERGRRLEVIDTWTGEVATPRRAEPSRQRTTAPSPIARDRPAALDSRGQRILHTQGWYDARGPRTITVSAAGERRLQGLAIAGVAALMAALVLVFIWWPLLLGLALIVGRGTVRQQLRTAATRFLDTLDQAA